MGEPFTSLVDVCRRRAERQGDTPLYTFLGEHAEVESVVGYAELDRRCRAIAAELTRHTAPGDRVLLLHPPGRHFVEAFLGCLYAGRIAVPAYPPDPARPERTLPRLRAIARDAAPALVATTREIAALAALITEQVAELRDLDWLACDGLPDDLASIWSPAPCAPDAIAFLQYTSGSTSDPKGVVLTHANLVANLDAIATAFGHQPHSQGFIWLPPYHDMGLIGGILQPLSRASRWR